MKQKQVLIVGGGAAGMLCGIFAARDGAKVTIYEKNEKLGKKLFITGKGRCNITNACEIEDLFLNVVTNSKFLYSAFYGFDNQAVMQFFEELGLNLKVERGNRVFPQSDHSYDVIAALERELRKWKVTVCLNTPVLELITREGCVTGVKLKEKEVLADAVVVATGGFSYATTGSTGDGYEFAKATGNHVTELYPALVPLVIEEEFVKELQGLSLKNVTATITDGKRQIYQEFGEMLFTHYGVSGPLILSASSSIGKKIKNNSLLLSIDFKPALTMEQLDRRVVRDFESGINKSFKNVITGLFPSKLIPVMIARSGINPEKKVHDITKEERKQFVDLIKNFTMTITALRGFQEAIITKGGIDVKDINPSTMESKQCKNLYFIGEVLDLDALTGGFNLQIAWSTAVLAARNFTS